MKKYLGIELGSTRIKAVLIDESYASVASGAYDWENKLIDGYWTYSLDDVWAGLQGAYAELAKDYLKKYGEKLTTLDGLGISAMMHGYLAFDEAGSLLVSFRTWRNTTTKDAAEKLTARFNFNIPQRWSVSHLYQAILNNESHVKSVSFLTTLSGYVHWRLTGKKVLGVGDASGMFPIDSKTGGFDASMAESFKSLTDISLPEILPEVLSAGDDAGTLTGEGAGLLDKSGALLPGVPMCPPEGDAGTGMVATNSVAARTGNISAGTSVFAMLVLENSLSKLYTEIDMVTTPAGLPVAMVHCNSCTSDLDAWIKLFGEAAKLMGAEFSKTKLYDAFYNEALKGEADGGGIISYNYYSGETITGLSGGRPLLTRLPGSSMSLASFMRVQLYSTVATLKLGMDILTDKEKVKLDVLLGHGGLFKTPDVGQRLMATALNVPVAVMESAGEGGAWGIALLASYGANASGKTLEKYLGEVFKNSNSKRCEPDKKDSAGFKVFMERYTKGLEIERAAVENLN